MYLVLVVLDAYECLVLVVLDVCVCACVCACACVCVCVCVFSASSIRRVGPQLWVNSAAALWLPCGRKG